MRLLHIEGLRFEEFFDDEIPKYGILSHRWSKDEISYQEFVAGKKRDSIGYKKILSFCETLKSPNLHPSRIYEVGNIHWAWIDTCCIDKSSSAELSEAINSMYNWYKNAAVCLVHMHDVPEATIKDVDQNACFIKSEWFRRGWTLQELLAPRHVLFYDCSWKLIGSKFDFSDLITLATGIAEEYVTNLNDMSEASVATRMSWASERNTSRLEDIAYCLLGIFNVNMPLLYGEGKRAFRRLQEEIIRTSSDESIFAILTTHPETEGFQETIGILASSPKGFSESGRVYVTPIRSAINGRLMAPYQMTNLGLQMEISYIPLPTELNEENHIWNRNTRIGALNCTNLANMSKYGGLPHLVLLRRDSEQVVWACAADMTQQQILASLPDFLILQMQERIIEYQRETAFIEPG